MDLLQTLQALKSKLFDPPTEVIDVDAGRPPRLTAEQAAAFTPEQVEFSRQSGGLLDSTPPDYQESEGELANRARRQGLDPSRMRPDWQNRSNEANINAVNDQLDRQRAAASPNGNLSDAELDAKVQEQLGPKANWKSPAPTPEGMAMYNDLLAAAKKGQDGGDWEGSWGYGFGKPRPGSGVKALGKLPPMAKQPPPTATKTGAQASASPEAKTQTAPGGGAAGADPRTAALQMALGAIPNPDVRALMAKRLKLATDGDTELAAAQQREEMLGGLAGLQRQLGQAAATLGGDRYDDTAAAAAEKAAGVRTRGVMAQRELQDKNAQGALDIGSQLERERSNQAGEALKGRELDLEGKKIAEGERHNRAEEGIGWYDAKTKREKAGKEGAAFDKEVQKLAKEQGGQVAIGAQKLREIDSALRAQGIQGIDDTATKRDLQGAGPVTNLVTKLAGNLMVSQKGANLRNSVLGLAATIKYLRTGKTATTQEANEIAQEFGMAPGSSEQDFRQGIQRMRDEFISRAQQSEAGFSDRAVKTFEGRGGTTAKTLSQISRPPGVQDGMVRFQMPDGRVGWAMPAEVPQGARQIGR